MAVVRAHLVIHGLVQGVCFRMYTQQRARALGLAGWVRNRYDGTVEAAFEGEQDAVDAMVEWCRRGPRTAEVARVDVQWETPRGEGGDFVIRPTA